MEPMETLKKWTAEAHRMVFFGGAGVSTESGIPDFRSVDGLYHQQFDYPPEKILSAGFFRRQPKDFHQFYSQKILLLDAQPNAAHRKLAQWEREERLLAVVTQNIDGLHQKAGSKRVFELHGSVLRNYCVVCGQFYDPTRIRDSEGVPRCDCGGLIKPDVVLYEEALDEACVTGAIEAISKADLLIVGGTSLTVYPAAGLLDFYRGSRLALINRDKTEYDGAAGLILRAPIATVFAQL